MAERDGPELELRDYLRVLARRKWIVALATVAMVGVSLVLALRQTPMYRSSSELLLQAGNSASLLGVGSEERLSVITEIQVLQSQPVRDLVQEKLGSAPPVSATSVAGSAVIRVVAEASEPDEAAEAANAYVASYIEYRRQQAIDEVAAASAQIEPKIVELQARVDEINGQIAAAPLLQRPALEDQLGSERDSLENQKAGFEQVIDNLRISSQLDTGGAEVVTPAFAPSEPFKPTPARNGLIALPVGLVFGLALALLVEYLDDSIKSKDDLERAAGSSAPVLGLIPAVEWKDRSRTQLVSLEKPTSPAAEAYRALRTAVQFAGIDRPFGTVQISSPAAAEGKSTTLANLAVVLARTGVSVVVVDCDLRRPRIHEFFDLPNEMGLTSVVLGQVPLSGALQEVKSEENLNLLASGPLPPNPSELLASQRTGEVLASLRAQGAILLLDCPPVMPVTDATVLSAWVDGTLLVTSEGLTTRRQVKRAIELLGQANAPLVGTVLNRAQISSSGYGYTAGYYRAGDETNGASRRPRRKTSTPESAPVGSTKGP